MCGIQRHVKNQRSIPRICNGAEEVGNLNSSIHRDSRSLNASTVEGLSSSIISQT